MFVTALVLAGLAVSLGVGVLAQRAEASGDGPLVSVSSRWQGQLTLELVVKTLGQWDKSLIKSPHQINNFNALENEYLLSIKFIKLFKISTGTTLGITFSTCLQRFNSFAIFIDTSFSIQRHVTLNASHLINMMNSIASQACLWFNRFFGFLTTILYT